ncbi:hypothetical protein JZU68_03925, partial [bacterium]|nr:hypothetical protein [bacterium]
APFFNTLFGIQKYSVKMFESPYNDLLYVSGTQIKSALKQKDGTYKVDSTSFFSLKDKLVPGFEHLTVLDATKMLIATEDGFSVIFKNRLSQKPEPFRVAIRSVLLTNNGSS